MTKANEEKVEVLYHGWVIANTRGLWILELPVESDNILRPDSLEEAKKFIDSPQGQKCYKRFKAEIDTMQRAARALQLIRDWEKQQS
jgi:hypothetical protein